MSHLDKKTEAHHSLAKLMNS